MRTILIQAGTPSPRWALLKRNLHLDIFAIIEDAQPAIHRLHALQDSPEYHTTQKLDTPE